MLTGQKRLKCVKGRPTYCNLVPCILPPALSCIARDITQRIYIVCCLDNHRQTDQYLAGSCLYPIVFVFGGFLARWSDNSSPLHMTLTRTVVLNVGGMGLARGSSANAGEGRETGYEFVLYKLI